MRDFELFKYLEFKYLPKKYLNFSIRYQYIAYDLLFQLSFNDCFSLE